MKVTPITTLHSRCRKRPGRRVTMSSNIRRSSDRSRSMHVRHQRKGGSRRHRHRPLSVHGVIRAQTESQPDGQRLLAPVNVGV